jgi:uncharacterized protein
MFGASYLGSTQWTAAIAQPPSLAAIAPGLTWSDPLDGLYARGGALELGLALPWTLETGAAYIAKQGLSATERERRVTAILDDYDRLADKGCWDLPVTAMPVLKRHGVPDIGTFRMLTDPDLVERARVAGRQHRVSVPALHIGGWYDAFLQGTLDNHVAMAQLGRPTRLVVGPWAHNLTLADPVGELCFGVRSGAREAPGHDLATVHVEWFRRHLVLNTEAESGEAPVRIFVMGRNVWRDESDWPLARARIVKWFLGAAGALHPELPGADDFPTEFVYDPQDPVPTVGGQTCMEPSFLPGAVDQARVESRPDVCCFTSQVLDADVEVTGRVRVILHGESSARTTDWVARLCDVHPDGRSFNVCDGILRVSEDATTCQQLEIDLWSTSIVFLAGHRLRVQVTSSSFPRWDRNLNTGNQRTPHFEVAHQRLYHDTLNPSWIELPVTS